MCSWETGHAASGPVTSCRSVRRFSRFQKDNHCRAYSIPLHSRVSRQKEASRAASPRSWDKFLFWSWKYMAATQWRIVVVYVRLRTYRQCGDNGKDKVLLWVVNIGIMERYIECGDNGKVECFYELLVISGDTDGLYQVIQMDYRHLNFESEI